jgi:alpha-glucosidase (family GH31 glycosyl hydrolase)
MNEPAVFHIITMPDHVKFLEGTHRETHNLYGMLMAKASFEGL